DEPAARDVHDSDLPNSSLAPALALAHRCSDALAERALQALRDRAGAAVADVAAVHARDGEDLRRGPGEEELGRREEAVQRDGRLRDRDAELFGEAEDPPPRDAGEDVVARGIGDQRAVVDGEEVRERSLEHDA